MVAAGATWKELKSTLYLDGLDLGCAGIKAQVQIGGNVECVDTDVGCQIQEKNNLPYKLAFSPRSLL